MTKELITAKELAHHLNINVNVIYNWVVIYKDVPYHKVQSKLRFTTKEIQDWLQSRKDKKVIQREKSAKYYGVRDKITSLLSKIVKNKIDKEELHKILDYINGLEAVQKLKGANDNE